MTNKSNIPSCLSEEDVSFLTQNPGITIGSGGKPAEVIQASRSVDISEPSRKGLRPNIPGNSVDSTGERIKVSPNLAAKLAAGDAHLRSEAAKQKSAELERIEQTDIDKILARLNFLERSNKKLQSEINRLKKEQ